MDAEHKILYQIRSEISEHAYQVEVLLKKIMEYEENAEIVTLSEIARHICKKIKNKSEKCGVILEHMKDR